MTGTVLASDAHRSLATGEVALRDYTEAVVQRAARIKGTDLTPCPTADDLNPTDTGAVPAGWTGSIDSIEYWIPDADGGHWGSVGDCTARTESLCGGATSAAVAPSCAPGLVRLTLHLNNPKLTQVSTKDMRGTILVRRSNSP
jgi:hypothetical protein